MTHVDPWKRPDLDHAQQTVTRTPDFRDAMTASTEPTTARDTDLQGGLTADAAYQRWRKTGPMPGIKPRSVVRVLVEVVSEPMFLLLVGLWGHYLLLGDRRDAAMLLGFVFVVMGISFIQQQRTERSLDALREPVQSPRAGCARRATGASGGA